MGRKICIVSLIMLSVVMTYGCNIVPKSVQYQREEKELVGSVDIANPVVEEIQVFLTKNGYDTETQDGRMGQKTRDAIKDFQESIGLKPTGYINEVTLRQIEDTRRARERKDLEKTYSVEVRSAFPEKVSTVASVSQWTIKDVQAALKNAGFDPGSIDGKLGPRTQQAIKEFQRAKGLKIDGKVGPKTWAELSKYQKK